MSKAISTPLAIIIIIVLAVLVGGVAVWWYLIMPKEELKESKSEYLYPVRTYHNEELGFSFSYPVDWSGPVTGWKAEKNPFWIVANPYNKESEGIGDFVVSENVKKQGTCKSFIEDENASIIWKPRPNEQHYICKVFKHPKGPIIIYGIGLSSAFEGAYYLSAVILILQNERSILMYRWLDYSSEIKQIIKEASIEFDEKYPNDPYWFGHPFISEMNLKIFELLKEEIILPSQRVTKAIQILEEIIRSIDFSN